MRNEVSNTVHSLDKRDAIFDETSLFILAILTTGIGGIVAQVLILRELLVGFYGNELSLGIILANWVLIEASGGLIIGKLIDGIKNKINVFCLLQIIFSFSLPASIYFARIFKGILHLPLGEGIGVVSMFGVSFLALLPTAFCHGGLFTNSCKMLASIGRTYAWETIGTITGGLLLTYFLLPRWNAFQIAVFIAVANLSLCLILLKHLGRPVKICIFIAVLLWGFLLKNGGVERIQRTSLNKQWSPNQLIDNRNSLYGNIAVIKKEGQLTFFYNGLPIITSPYPDVTFVQEFGHFPLLFHRSPKDVLIVGAGAGGLIREVLKERQVQRIDYTELDPMLIQALKDYYTHVTYRELNDVRVHIIRTDGRFFIRTTPQRYDIIMIGYSKPADLSTNRFFTEEFFALAKRRMKPDGILALWLPGSNTYLSPELKACNNSIIRSLKDVFANTRIIPEEYNIILASDDRSILDVTPAAIVKRIEERNIRDSIFIPGYIEYRLNPRRVEWFNQTLRTGAGRPNRDLSPFVVFVMLEFWNKLFSPRYAYIFQLARTIDLKDIGAGIALFALLYFYFFNCSRRREPVITYGIATTGFFAMLASLMLMFCFQVFYGYLYYTIGMLMSIFMAGAALGSIFGGRRHAQSARNVRLFAFMEFLALAFCSLLALVLGMQNFQTHSTYATFALLFTASGFLAGFEFSLAGKIFSDDENAIGRIAGWLSASDLAGAWIAGMLGGIFFLPLLGVLGSCVVLIMLKASSLAILLSYLRKN